MPRTSFIVIRGVPEDGRTTLGRPSRTICQSDVGLRVNIMSASTLIRDKSARLVRNVTTRLAAIRMVAPVRRFCAGRSRLSRKSKHPNPGNLTSSTSPMTPREFDLTRKWLYGSRWAHSHRRH